MKFDCNSLCMECSYWNKNNNQCDRRERMSLKNKAECSYNTAYGDTDE